MGEAGLESEEVEVDAVEKKSSSEDGAGGRDGGGVGGAVASDDVASMSWVF